jgi:anaerobic glycerol-3-phosphate dehydrogenase
MPCKIDIKFVDRLKQHARVVRQAEVDEMLEFEEDLYYALIVQLESQRQRCEVKVVNQVRIGVVTQEIHHHRNVILQDSCVQNCSTIFIRSSVEIVIVYT